MITKSDEVLKLWNQLCDEFDDFWSDAMEDLEGITIDGSDYAYTVFEQLEFSKNWTYFWTGDNYVLFPVFEQLEFSKNWTYFWTGDNYVLFPCTERQLLKGLRDQKKKQKKYEDEAEEEAQDAALVKEGQVVRKWHVSTKPIKTDIDLTT